MKSEEFAAAAVSVAELTQWPSLMIQVPLSTSGSASMRRNTRSAPTVALSTELICCETWVMGWVKLLLSVRKATMVPRESEK